MSKWKIVASSLFVIVMVAIGLLFWKRQIDVAAERAHQTEVAAKRAQANARLNGLVKQQARISDLQDTFANNIASYGRNVTDAFDAGQARHDSSDNDDKIEKAKQELTDVSGMTDSIQQERSTLSELADAFADVLGDGPVNDFRATSGQITQDEAFSQTRWYRAISDISDSLSKGTYTSEDVGKLYEESNDYDTRAITQFQQLTHEVAVLNKQVQGRVDKAKNDLAALGVPGSPSLVQPASPSHPTSVREAELETTTDTPKVDVYAICSYGPGGCGASGDGFDETRPQDLSYVRAYKVCESTDFSKAPNMVELRMRCAEKAGIGHIEDGANYHGPVVKVLP